MRITKENLQRYDQNLKWWHQNRMATKNALRSYHLTEDAGAVAFYPVGGSALGGTAKFSFTETPPASGDKSPTNPSTISGVENVRVFHASANLLPETYSLVTSTDAPLTVVQNSDGSITINGATLSNKNAYSYIFGQANDYSNKNVDYPIPASFSYSWGYTVVSGTASITDSGIATESTPIALQVMRGTGVGNASIMANSTPDTESTRQNDTPVWIKMRVALWKNYTFNNYRIKPHLRFTNLSVVSETSGAPCGEIYTLPLGNTYYGGEIDLATGLMTVTHKADIITHDGRAGSVLTDTVNLWCYSSSRHIGGSSNVYWACDKFPCLTPSNTDVEHIRPTGSPATGTVDVAIYVNKSRLDVSGAANPSAPTDAEWRAAANAWLANNPVTFVYQLKTPITVQLSPLALTALAQTSRHEPRLNTVYTDADSIQITYQKSPIRAATEQEMAILGLGGNV